jgi:hypothetical protein
MFDYFAGLTTVVDIKARYRQLAKEYHPDLNHDRDTTRIMQVINAQYHEALDRQNGRSQMGDDGQARTYRYNQETEQAIMDKIAELLALDLPDCEVWLIGYWIWVRGETYPVRELLGDADMKWHGKRRAWYWKPYPGRSSYNPKVNLDGLASQYGYKTFSQEEDTPRPKRPALT